MQTSPSSRTRTIERERCQNIVKPRFRASKVVPFPFAYPGAIRCTNRSETHKNISTRTISSRPFPLHENDSLLPERFLPVRTFVCHQTVPLLRERFCVSRTFPIQRARPLLLSPPVRWRCQEGAAPKNHRTRIAHQLPQRLDIRANEKANRRKPLRPGSRRMKTKSHCFTPSVQLRWHGRCAEFALEGKGSHLIERVGDDHNFNTASVPFTGCVSMNHFN